MGTYSGLNHDGKQEQGRGAMCWTRERGEWRLEKIIGFDSNVPGKIDNLLGDDP